MRKPARSFPFSAVEVETTTACNRRCSYCPNSIYDRGLVENEQRMKRSVYEKLVDELAEGGYARRFSPHWFGEPLLDDRLPELLAYAREKLPYALISVFTNGDFLTLERYLELSATGIDHLVVTQHSKTPSPPMKKLLAFREEHGDDGLGLTYQTLDGAFDRGGLLRLGEEAFKREACTFPRDQLNINHRGEVVLCTNDYLSRHVFGSVEAESLWEILDKPERLKLVEEIEHGRFALEMCRKCGSTRPSRSGTSW